MLSTTFLNTELHFSKSIYETIPLKDLQDLLKNKDWKKKSGLNPNQERDITEGLRFIKQAIEGYYAIERTRMNYEITGDLQAVYKYFIIQRSLRDKLFTAKYNSIIQILDSVKETLEAILKYKIEAKDIQTSSIELSRNFFLLLSKDSFFQGDDIFSKNSLSYV